MPIFINSTDEAAAAINQLTQSDPTLRVCFAVTGQDFNSVEGVIKTLDYEIKNRKGELFGTWSEYIFSTIKEVNDQYAKKIFFV
jgi:hypothetical protein